jgi:hypothetical protein
MFCSYCHHYNHCPQCNLWFCEACGLELRPVGPDPLDSIAEKMRKAAEGTSLWAGGAA